MARTYCTRQDIVQRLGGEEQLPTINNITGNGIDEDRITKGISDAGGMIEMYCVWLQDADNTAPEAITTIATSIAVYYITNGVTARDTDLQLYKDGIALLKTLRNNPTEGASGKGAQPAVVEPTATTFPKRKGIGY